jgi:hypothetical protein
MFIRLMLFFSVFFFHLYSQTGSFTTTPTEIPGGTTPEYTVTPCYITKSNQILFAWADNDTSDDPIKYVVYNGKKNTYTAPETIEGSAVYQNIFCCYNESTNQVFFSWEDAVSFKPYYAIYNTSNGSLDAEPTIINAGGYNGVVWNNNVFCCYNNISNQVVFTWSDGAAGSPYYAIYDCQNKNFSTNPTQIGSVTNIAADVFACCSNNKANQIVFSWIEGSSPYLVQYAICDGKSGKITTGPTSIAGSTAAIPGNDSGVGYTQAACCYSNFSNQVIFSWVGGSNTVNIPYYAILNVLNNTISTPPTPIVTESYVDSISDFVFCSYSSDSNQVFFSWVGYESTIPYYSIYNMTKKNFNSSSPSLINGTTQGAHKDVFSSYNSTTDQIVFGWSQYDETIMNYVPYYAVYVASSAQRILVKSIIKASPLKPQ